MFIAARCTVDGAPSWCCPACWSPLVLLPRPALRRLYTACPTSEVCVEGVCQPGLPCPSLEASALRCPTRLGILRCSMEGMRRFKLGAAALAQYALEHRAEVHGTASCRPCCRLSALPPFPVHGSGFEWTWTSQVIPGTALPFLPWLAAALARCRYTHQRSMPSARVSLLPASCHRQASLLQAPRRVPQMWGLLAWQGRHPQAPVAVAQRSHYFCELDVPRTLRHLIK